MSQQVLHDKQDQLEQVQQGLLAGESVWMVFDAIGTGTGFIGLTDRRVILQDKSFAGGETAVTSVPYSRVTAVSMVANKSMLGGFFGSSSIVITAGPQSWSVDFRGPDKARQIHDTILRVALGL